MNNLPLEGVIQQIKTNWAACKPEARSGRFLTYVTHASELVTRLEISSWKARFGDISPLMATIGTPK